MLLIRREYNAIDFCTNNRIFYKLVSFKLVSFKVEAYGLRYFVSQSELRI